MNNTWAALRVSLQVSLLGTLIVTFLGGAIAYFLTRYKFPGQGFLETLLSLPLVLPPTVIGFYLLLLFGRNGLLGKQIYAATGWTLVLTWQGAVVAAVVVALPLMVKTTKTALEAVNPIHLEAAYSLGLSQIQTLQHIWLPLAWRGITSGIVLSFARILGEFGATVMLAGNIPGETQTLAIAIYDAVQAGDDSLSLQLVVILTTISGMVLFAVNSLGRQQV